MSLTRAASRASLHSSSTASHAAAAASGVGAASAAGAGGAPGRILTHNLPVATRIVAEADDHLVALRGIHDGQLRVDDRATAPLLVDLQPAAVSNGNALHLLPASSGVNGSRTLLVETILQQESRLTFCWWIAATEAIFIEKSLAGLCDALDHTEAVSKLDHFPVVLQAHVEQQRERGRCAVFVLEDCNHDGLFHFLAHLAPRWGCHVIVLPSIDVTSPQDLLDDTGRIRGMCSSVYFPTYPPPPHDIISTLDDSDGGTTSTADAAAAEWRRRRCEALIPHLHSGFIDASWLMRAVGNPECVHRLLLLRICIAAMENIGCDTYELFHKISAARQDLVERHIRDKNKRKDVTSVGAAIATTSSDRSMTSAAVAAAAAAATESCFSIAAVFRVFADSLACDSDREWLWGMMALPRMFPSVVLPEHVVQLLSHVGIVTCLVCRGSLQRDPITMLLVPSWLMQALERTATEAELRAATATVISKLEYLTELHLTSAVLLPQWSPTSVEVTAVNERGDDVSVLTTALISEGSGHFRESSEQSTWRLWGPVLIRWVIAVTRRRMLFFPRIAQLLIPDSQRTLKITDVPELPQDPREWTAKLVIKYGRQTARLMEESRALEAASACEKVICVLLSLSEHDSCRGNELLLHGVCQQYLVLAGIYVRARIAGLAETYVDRAVALLEALSGRRRDTPARAAPLLTSGQMMLELSAAEMRCANAIRESAVLAADTSDMQLKTGVKAEVGAKEYLHHASVKFREAADVLKSVPPGLVGAELALCYESASRSHHAGHKDRDALAAAEAALAAFVSTERGLLTSVSSGDAPATRAGRSGGSLAGGGSAAAARLRKRNVLVVRDEITWVHANAAAFISTLVTKDYRKANGLLDRSLLLSHCVVIPAVHARESATSTAKQVVVFCDGRELKETLRANTVPAPRFFESTQLWTTLTEATVAKHHGRDWQRTTHPYLLPTHELLRHADAESAEATSLLRRLLDTGVSPQCSSPHDGKTLLHIAIERRMAAAVQVLMGHGGVDVEFRSPFVLCAERRGLSTAAVVTRVPSTVPTPIEACNEPQLLLALLLQSSSPREVFQRNRVLIVERLGLSEDSDHLRAILAPGKPFCDQVLPLLAMDCDEGGRAITSETKERIAAYCPAHQLVDALMQCDDEHVIFALGTQLAKAYDRDMLEANRLLCAVATHYIRENRPRCASQLFAHFSINPEMLFWEDVAAYNTAMKNEREDAKKGR